MDLFEKIKETKKFAREKNVPNWYVCLLDAIVITVVLSSTLALYSYVAFDNMIQNMTYQPYWVKPVMVIIDYLPMVFAGLFLLKFDKLIMERTHGFPIKCGKPHAYTLNYLSVSVNF